MQQLELDFTAAQCWRGPDGDWLMLKIDNAPAARRWIDQMSGDCTVALGPKRRKRSLDANAYLWVLCDQIAKVIRSTKEEVYRAAIKRVGPPNGAAAGGLAALAGWSRPQTRAWTAGLRYWPTGGQALTARQR